ncbi:MAG: hypothetical protein R2867_41005 [Caldilineaceae bacterium]
MHILQFAGGGKIHVIEQPAPSLARARCWCKPRFRRSAAASCMATVATVVPKGTVAMKRPAP